MDPPRCRLNQDRRGSQWCAGVALAHLAWGCLGQADDPAILGMTPSLASPEADTPVQIEGRNLQNRIKIILDDDSPPEIDSHWAVRVGGTEARDVTLIDRSTLSALIPAGLPPGVYDVSVTVPGGAVFRLPEALTVRQWEPASGPDASAGGPGGQGGVADAGGSADAGVVSGPLDTGGPCSEFSPPERLSGFGLTGNLYGPTLSLDAQQLFFAQFSTVEAVVSARRSDRGPVFSLATSVAGVNAAGNNGTPFLTQDGLTLYFYSDRAGGVGSRDIWRAHRSDPSAAWQDVAPVPVINSSSLDHVPTLSADQLTLVFASDRSGLGGGDLWIAERGSVSANFSPPQNLRALNTPVEDSGPSLSSDGLTLYFSSKRPSATTSDIWVATRPDRSSSFGTPVKLDAVSSPADDLNVTLSPDRLELVLSSNRSGSYQLWRSLRSCP